MTPLRTAFAIEFIEFKGVDIGQKGMIVAVPIFKVYRNQNLKAVPMRFSGVVVCTVKLETVTERFIADLKYSDGIHPILLDSDFHLLWSVDKSLVGENFLKKSSEFPEFQKIIGNMFVKEWGTATFEFYGFDDSIEQYTMEVDEHRLVFQSISLGPKQWALALCASKKIVQDLIRSVFLKQIILTGFIIFCIVMGSLVAIVFLYRINRILEDQIKLKTSELKRSEEALKNHKIHLEEIVQQRTGELNEVNQQLEKELLQRKKTEIVLNDERNLFVTGSVVVFKFRNEKGWPVEYVTPNVESILGYTKDEFLNRDVLFKELVVKEDIYRLVGEIDAAIDNGLVFIEHEPFRIVNQTGKQLWLYQHTRLIKDQHGYVVNFHTYLFDISTYKETENKLQDKQAQLIHAGRLTSLGELATGLAHEINQPFTIIRLAGQWLQRHFVADRSELSVTETVNDIVEQVDRGSSILNNMRAFARSKDELPKLVDLAVSIQRALSFFREQFRLHDISLVENVEEKLPKFKINSQKYEQIVVNLLSNARFAVEKKAQTTGVDYKKEIRVQLVYDDSIQALELEVEDNGVGMSADTLHRCMDPFFTSKEVGEGTGLGLHLVLGIVNEYKLQMDIDSVEGEGSTFRVLAFVKRIRI
ncbi:MAG: PAS domain-containing protein [Proteobacteria bacterium]|nr:PAS domain-containing protein [Pseudomonadota bacterium]